MRTATGGDVIAKLLVGEIHTVLLHHSTALTSPDATELLTLIPQHPVRTWERPIRQAASPTVLTGVDCDLPARSGTRVRCVGTVASDVWVTGGHLLQSSSRAGVVGSESGRRRPWSHYLARPGVLESIPEAGTNDVIDGFLGGPSPKSSRTLDLSSITDRVMNGVQSSAALDHRPPFRQGRTRLRWSALAADGEGAGAIRFSLDGDGVRSVRLRAPTAVLERLPEFCQDLARHDWLLSALITMIDAARTGRREKAEVVERLRPAMDHLVHAWMPAARLPDELLEFWHELDRRAGLSRQWESAVSRIRDQVALASAEQLARAADVITLPTESGARSR
jgi:hypothetical protein